MVNNCHRTTVLMFGLILLPGTAGWTHAIEIEHPMFRAIRKGDTDLVRSFLKQGTSPNLKGQQGVTPLLLASLFGSAECVDLLLKHGADPNASSKKGVTALLWSAGDEKKVKLLLAAGANVNSKSSLGNSPLITAAAYPGKSGVVRLLLAHGADVTARNRRGISALRNAVTANDVETTKLLLTVAAKKNQTDALVGNDTIALLESAADRGSQPLVNLLLDHLEEKLPKGNRLPGRSLTNALLSQKPEIARQLIEQGANLNRKTSAGQVPQIVLAAYIETDDDSVARLMIEKGVDISQTNSQGESVLTWAQRRGHPTLLATLKQAGAPEVPDNLPDIPDRNINLHAGNQQRLLSEAITKSIRLLQHSSDVFLEKRGSCISCHHQNMPAVAVGWARDRGFEVDKASIKNMIERQIKSWEGRIDRMYQMDRPVPVPPRFVGYGLWGFSALGYPADDLTDAFSWYQAQIQQPDGHWVAGMIRPPMGGADIASTVLAMRSLQLYAPAALEREFQKRVERAAEWLAAARPRYHQERVYRVLGLGWAGRSASDLESEIQQLISEQRKDGGWAQLENLKSDAWATGQTLVALHIAGGLPTTDPVYQRGMRFLLNTQFNDGAWFVKTRTWPFQAHFDSEFPFDRDQWIAAPATAWATMALTLAVEPQQATVPDRVDLDRWVGRVAPSARNKKNENKDDDSTIPTVASVDFARDIKPLLERSCAGCHHGDEPKGGLRVTHRASLLEGGESGEPSITPGSIDASPLLDFVADKEPDMKMPPTKSREKFPPLSKSDIAKLRLWIETGAVWPEGVKVVPPAY